jgi:hypothetical protein
VRVDATRQSRARRRRFAAAPGQCLVVLPSPAGGPGDALARRAPGGPSKAEPGADAGPAAERSGAALI